MQIYGEIFKITGRQFRKIITDSDQFQPVVLSLSLVLTTLFITGKLKEDFEAGFHCLEVKIRVKSGIIA